MKAAVPSSTSTPTASANMTNATTAPPPIAALPAANMTPIQRNQPTINQANNYQFVREWGSNGTKDGQFNYKCGYYAPGITLDPKTGDVYVCG